MSFNGCLHEHDAESARRCYSVRDRVPCLPACTYAQQLATNFAPPPTTNTVPPAGHKLDAGIPTDPQARKNAPLVTGLLDYFPLACLAVAELSRVANEQHNPGQPMHWAREKSADHADCIGRHLLERGTLDADGQRHSAKVAWRALAALQLELEAEIVAGRG